MEERLISKEVAVLARELGLEIKSDRGYYRHGTEEDFEVLLLWCGGEPNKPEFGHAPTQALFQKLLREKCETHICIYLEDTPKDFYWEGSLFLSHVKERNYIDEIMWDEPSEVEVEGKHRSYEDALEACFLVALNRIKINR